MMETVLEILIPVLASVLTALSAIALRKLQQKFEIELSLNEQQAIRGLVRDGIASAEEWAARKANLEQGAIVRGRDKAARVSALVKAVYPKLSDNEIAVLIDAEIARTEGLGATQKKIEV